MNIKTFFLFTVGLLLINQSVKGQFVSGRTYDSFNFPIAEVTVFTNSERTISDENGYFFIQAGLGDSLYLSHENYLDTTIQIVNLEEIKAVVPFNRKQFFADIKNDSSVNFHLKYGGSQPLFILNGKYPGYNIPGLDPDDIIKIEIIKGKNATDQFGDYARNGAVLITSRPSSPSPIIKHISLSLRSDLFYAPFGLSIGHRFDHLFNLKNSTYLSGSFMTNGRNNHALSLSLGPPLGFRTKWFDASTKYISTSFYYERIQYQTEDFSYDEFAIDNQIYARKFFITLSPAIQRLNGNINPGIKTDISYSFTKAGFWLGGEVGYWGSNFTYKAYLGKSFSKNNWDIFSNFTRIANLNRYQAGIRYLIPYTKKLK